MRTDDSPASTAFALQEAEITQRLLAEKVKFPRLQDDLKQTFTAHAQDALKFHSLFKAVFGEDIDANQVESLRQDAVEGRYDWLPVVKWVSAEEMPQGYGAYHEASDTIFMNEAYRDTGIARKTFVEEVGHALDARLNTVDTTGDEGEHFELSLSGVPVSEQRLAEIQSEDDAGQIMIGGKTLNVEFAFGSWFRKNVVASVKHHVIDPMRDETHHSDVSDDEEFKTDAGDSDLTFDRFKQTQSDNNEPEISPEAFQVLFETHQKILNG